MDDSDLAKIGMSTKLVIDRKEPTRQTFIGPGFFKEIEDSALLAESITAPEENPSEKTHRIPDEEGKRCISAKMRICESDKRRTSGETDTREICLPGEFDTNVAFEANEWWEHEIGPGQTRTKKDSVI